MNIDLHIEELILHGFAPSDRHRIAESMQRELLRLLAGHALPPGRDRNRESSRVDGGAFIVGTTEKPESIGVRVGQAVYEGIRPSLTAPPPERPVRRALGEDIRSAQERRTRERVIESAGGP